MPGSTPATSKLDWLISTTAITVLSWSRATRDLLKSFGWGIRALHQLVAATMVPSPRRLPHTISPLEERRFEPPVPPTVLRPFLSDPRLFARAAPGRGTEIESASSAKIKNNISEELSPGPIRLEVR